MLHGKKAIGGRALNILVSIGIIALLIYGFYAYYGLRGSSLESRISATTKGLEQSSDLLSLLRTPVSPGKNIADLIAQGDESEAASKINQTLNSVFGASTNYQFFVDDNDEPLAESKNKPKKTSVQEAAIPNYIGDKILQLKLVIER